MKPHSTNYINTFIEVAEDCPASTGEVPPTKGDKKSVANYQFELLESSPYKFDSDALLFLIFATRKAIDEAQWKSERQAFFSKGQPCLRASPLTKRYGWGVHSDEKGRIAIFGVESKEYKKFVADPSLKKVKAMKTKR